ncbi:MAG: DUF1565 domain-containing protein [Anaerolineae bacterium]|nr:DUF1565 domain-containing protein [Anaerolineae bacterium]
MKTKYGLIPLAMVLGLAMALLMSAALIAPARAQSVTYYVNAATGDDSRTPGAAQDPSTPWQSISHAVDSVPPGTPDNPTVIIQVASGMYDTALGETFPIFIDIPNVHLIGAGAGLSIIDGEPTADVIVVTKRNVTVEGFTIQGTNDVAISAGDGGLTVRNNVFQDVGSGVSVWIQKVDTNGGLVVQPLLVSGNAFTISQRAVDISVDLNGAGSPTHAIIGTIDILSNTVVFSGTPASQYMLRVHSLTVKDIAGGEVTIDTVTFADNEVYGGSFGIDFFGELDYLTDTLVTVGDVVIRDNVLQGQTDTGIYADHYDAEEWHGSSTGTLGDLVIHNNAIDTHATLPGRSIFSDLGYLEHFHDTAALTTGGLILTDNRMYAVDGVEVDYSHVYYLYGSAAITVGNALLAGNMITTTSGDGYYVMHEYAGAFVYSDTAVTLGDMTFAANTIHAAGEGIFIDTQHLGYEVYNNAVVSLGDITIANNVISSTYGIDVKYYYSGEGVHDSASVALGHTSITDNYLGTSVRGIYYYLQEVGYDVGDNASVQVGALDVSSNTLDAASDGVYVDFESTGCDMTGSATLVMSDTLIQGNVITADGEGISITYYDVSASNAGDARVTLPSHVIRDNTVSASYNGAYFYSINNPYNTFGNALLDFGTLTIDANRFSGGQRGIYIDYEDVCNGCNDGSGAVIGDVAVSNNVVSSTTDGGIYLTFYGLGSSYTHTGTVTLGDVAVENNEIENTLSNGISVNYRVASQASATTTVGSLLVAANEIRNALDGIYVSYYMEASDTSAVNVDRPWVRQNVIDGCQQDGIDLLTTVVAGAGTVTLTPPWISGNTVLGCPVNLRLTPAAHPVQVANNILAQATLSGVEINAAATVNLLHNTIAEIGTQTRAPAAGAAGIRVTAGTVNVRNTILVSCTTSGYGIYNGGGTVSEDYNLFAAVLTNTWGTVTGGAHSISNGNPAFVDPAAGDYHITPDSDAVDAGMDVNVLSDIDGDDRPLGAGFDIGADEVLLKIYLPLVLRDAS